MSQSLKRRSLSALAVAAVAAPLTLALAAGTSAVAKRTATATHAGTVALPVTLTHAARGKLVAGEQLKLVIRTRPVSSHDSVVTIVPVSTP